MRRPLRRSWRRSLRRSLRAIASLALSIVVLAPHPASAQATTIEILTLKNRRPEDLVPTLAPLAGPGGAVTAHEGRLIVRAGAAEMARIKDTLRSLDGPARMVSVSVRQIRQLGVATQSASAAVEGRAGSPAASRAVRPATAGTESPPDARAAEAVAASGTTSQAQAEESRLVTQVLQVTEGAGAFIEVGSVYAPSGGPPSVAAVPVEAATGFFAIPRLTEDGFTLEISARQEDLTDHGRVEGGRLSATLAGPLGRWIPVGSTLRAQARSAAGSLSARLLEAIDQRSLELRVDAVP